MTPVFVSVKLNPEQNAAVRATEGPCLVVAGPGSGKTRTLAAKALRILRSFPGAKVLCITHTRKAADEMRARIRKHPDTGGVEISTIHSLCYKILRRAAGKPVRIISDYDQAAIVRRASQTAGLEIDHKDAAKLLSYAKLGLTETSEDIKKILKTYEKLKGDRLDYGDLLLCALRKLRRDKSQRGDWTHILVDEAQDLDPIQIEIIKYLAGKTPNISFFLDHNQAIFSFKGAVLDEIARIEKIYPNGRKFYLLRNHRSTRRILESANRLIRMNGDENLSIPMRGEGEYPLWVDAENERAEAALAAETTRELIRNGLEPREILILYRVNHYRAEVENELINREIPYSVLKNRSIFQKGGPFLPFCLQAWRPNDQWEQALLANYIGRHNADDIASLAKNWKLGPLDAAVEESVIRPELEGGIDLLLGDLREIQRMREGRAADVAQAAWGVVQRRDFIIDPGEIKGLSRILKELKNIGELAALIETLENLNRAPKEKRLHLSTIHRAKGLEHEAVILLGCVEGMLPLRIGEETDIAEERRLAYVALTRAKSLFIAISPKQLHGEETVPSRFLREMGLKKADWLGAS